MDELRFGIFDWIDHNSALGSLPENYEQRLQMLEYADEAGFWCYHLAEHHGTPLGLAPSPNLFLAAATQRTKRLRLGPLVQLLPLNNPLRNIEEVCVLDNLCNGRLELGVGRGVNAAELATYGVAASESRDRFRECLDILVQGMATGRVTHDGHYYKLDGVGVPIRPVQQPYPPLWYPTSNKESIEWVAREGMSTILGFTRAAPEDVALEVRHYKDAAASAVRSPRLNGHVANPRYGVQCHVYVDETDERATDTGRAAYSAFDRNYTQRPGNTSATATSRRGDFDTAIATGSIMVGSPQTVRGQVQRLIDLTGANYFCGTFAFGNQTTPQLLRSIRLFAEEVMPAIKPAAEVPA